jgi:hypothetical protein
MIIRIDMILCARPRSIVSMAPPAALVRILQVFGREKVANWATGRKKGAFSVE